MLWFDIETSDSDENAPHAALLEVGITITDDSGKIISEKNFVNQLNSAQLEKVSQWPYEVLNMHMQNGLYREVMEKRYFSRSFQDEILFWLHQKNSLDGPPLREGELLLLAGSGVSHFDRRWVKKLLPRLDQYLTHYAIDVGVMRRMLEMHAPQLAARARHVASRGISAGTPAHRALTCNRQSIQAYQYYVNLIRDLSNQEADKRAMGREMNMMLAAANHSTTSPFAEASPFGPWVHRLDDRGQWEHIHPDGYNYSHAERYCDLQVDMFAYDDSTAETATPTADVRPRAQHQPGARAFSGVAAGLCGLIGPRDTCTYEPHPEGTAHSWE
jgi:oligoribonuclease (3'-5' exoribonuclease)